MIERSKAIKCPTVSYQLAGTKRVQQSLFERGTIERFIKNQEVSKRIAAVFVEQFSFDVINSLFVCIIIENKKIDVLLLIS
jgi:glutathione synthase